MVTGSGVSPVDRAALDRLRRLGGEPLLARMLDLFLENSVRRMEAARAGRRDGDLEAVAHAVHSLKSTAANVGAHRLHHVAEQVEILADRRDRDGVAGRFAELESVFAAARARLALERSELPV